LGGGALLLRNQKGRKEVSREGEKGSPAAFQNLRSRGTKKESTPTPAAGRRSGRSGWEGRSREGKADAKRSDKGHLSQKNNHRIIRGGSLLLRQ